VGASSCRRAWFDKSKSAVKVGRGKVWSLSWGDVVVILGRCRHYPGEAEKDHLRRDKSEHLRRDKGEHLRRDKSGHLRRDRSEHLRRDKSEHLRRDKGEHLRRG
jgi:hypothetical protein